MGTERSDDALRLLRSIHSRLKVVVRRRTASRSQVVIQRQVGIYKNFLTRQCMSLDVLDHGVFLYGGDFAATSFDRIPTAGCSQQQRQGHHCESDADVSNNVWPYAHQKSAADTLCSGYPREHDVPNWCQVHEMNDVRANH